MCGIFYSLNCPDHILNEKWLLTRGPDGKKQIEIDNQKFIHYHLATTPASKPGIQPLVNNYGTLMFNGTTYHKNQSEYEYWHDNLDDNVENIHSTIQSANGEFALIWVTDSTITVATDVFATKPLWIWQNRDQFIASSVRSSIHSVGYDRGIYRMKPNSIITFDKKTGQIVKESAVWIWDIAQTVDSYDMILETFEQVMMEMNTVPDKTGMGLSSGIDSGVIDCCLKNTQPISVCVTDSNFEDHSIVHQRKDYKKSYTTQMLHTFPLQEYESVRELWADGGQDSFWNCWDQDELTMHIIGQTLQRKGIKICFSGSGCDEIYSDYGYQGERYRSHSNFGGHFPDNLQLIWPYWQTNNWLAYDVQLTDEIGGMYGMETRFPLIDRRLVQAFISTTAKCKNHLYKGWCQKFMKKHDYPFHTKKIGYWIEKYKSQRG